MQAYYGLVGFYYSKPQDLPPSLEEKEYTLLRGDSIDKRKVSPVMAISLVKYGPLTQTIYSPVLFFGAAELFIQALCCALRPASLAM